MESQISLWDTELFAGEILQRKGSTRLQSKSDLYGDKEETRIVHQYRALRDELCINFGKKDGWISETIARE